MRESDAHRKIHHPLSQLQVRVRELSEILVGELRKSRTAIEGERKNEQRGEKKVGFMAR
jgi:hypothetical protein